MNFGLNQEQENFKQQIIEFAGQMLGKDIASRDANSVFDRAGWDQCGTLLLQGLAVPKAYGGKGLDALSTVLALEALGYGSKDNGLNFSIAAHLLACVVPIWLHGSEAQKQRLLPDLCMGKMIAANAMTEVQSGSDAFELKTTAQQSDNGYLLNGHKTFCANAPIADLILTYALSNPDKGFYGGITAFLLEKGKQSFNIESIQKTGLRTCTTGTVQLHDAFVPTENRLNEAGAGGIIFNQSMEWERICLGALHLGTMQRLLEQTIRFVKKRKSGGKSIGKYQSIAHQLVDMKAHLEAARLVNYQTAQKLDSGKKVAMDASMSKLLVSELYKDMTVRLMQIYASQAYVEGSEIERNMRDAMSATVYSGTSEIQRNIIAKWMGI